MRISSFGPLRATPRGGRRVWRFAWPLLTMVAAWSLQSLIVGIAAVGLAFGENGPPFQCWGRTVSRGYEDYCVAAWGWWSPLLYLPEVLIFVTVIGAIVARSRRLLRIGALAALGSTVVVLVVIWASHGWAVNQMPLARSLLWLSS